jgi:hypothetical protein
MSEINTGSEPTVQLYIGASGKPASTSVDEANIFEEYVVKQNLILQEENKSLAATERHLRCQIRELEDQVDNNERQVTQLKNYVRNFHDVGEIHKTIAKADLRYFHTVSKLEERERLVISLQRKQWSKSKYLNPSYLLMALMAIYVLASMYSTLHGTMSLVAVTTYYLYCVHPVLTGTNMAQEQLKHDRAEINKLLQLRKGNEKTLHGLEQTMDIIGKFIDDAL